MHTVPELLAAARTTGDLVPYMVILALGFLVGAWGQSARSPIAVIAGILLIMFAVGGFILGNNSGGSGVPGVPGG